MSATVSFSLPSPRGPRTVTLSYARVGTGEPLLLLHGIGHHRQAWDPVVHLLAAERDVIAVDLPGFGESPALPEGLTHDLETVVPALGALCEALEIERPHVVNAPWAGCWPWSWAARSSYGPSPRSRPPGSGRRPNGGTRSVCCSRCGRPRGACPSRWSSGSRVPRPDGRC